MRQCFSNLQAAPAVWDDCYASASLLFGLLLLATDPITSMEAKRKLHRVAPKE